MQVPPSLLSEYRTVVLCTVGHACYDIPHSYNISMRAMKCTMCTILRALHKHDKQIHLTNDSYTNGDKNFEAICSKRHKFIVNVNNTANGCRTCHMLDMVRKRSNIDLIVYAHCLNMHEDCPIRLHCGNIIHNPHCKNQQCVQLSRGLTAAVRDNDISCDNYIVCNEDFYATPRQLKYGKGVLNCEENHMLPRPHASIITLKRTFEVLFDTTFDDHIFGTGIEFTGYNMHIRLAFTHLVDEIPKKCATAAAQWCVDNNIYFITIPSSVTKSSVIDELVVRELCALGLVHGGKREIYEYLRANINHMNTIRQMFPVRLYE